MADWADDVERELMKWDLEIHKGAIAYALRKARNDALEEAASYIEDDEPTLAAHIRKMKVTA